jgi:hypothetical protein
MTFIVENGEIRPVWSRPELRRRKMWIRARIPLAIWSVPEWTLMNLCAWKNKREFDNWFQQNHDSEHFLLRLKRLARRLGLKHWLLRK